MRSSIVVKARSCSLANTRSSGMRAIPTESDVTISHSTPAGAKPASRVRSVEA